MLPEFFISALREENPILLVQSAFFLKVAASSRFASNIKMMLSETSAESWIGRGGPMNWPAHSPKLTSTDFIYGV
jgi:hypothetical protein